MRPVRFVGRNDFPIGYNDTMANGGTSATVGATAHLEIAVVDGPAAYAPLDWPGDCGAEGCFVGRTRVEEHPDFGALVQLEYEVYEPMAGTMMRRLAEQAVERFGCRAVRMVHSRGVVGPGEASVVIQTATPHRGESFEACRYLIDTLKHELPIWKREIWQRGETFVEGCCAHRD